MRQEKSIVNRCILERESLQASAFLAFRFQPVLLDTSDFVSSEKCSRSSTLGLRLPRLRLLKSLRGVATIFSSRSRSIRTWSGNRTRTGLLPQDFKSCVSTNSTIQANCFSVEASAGFEPAVKLLQSHALPLGYDALSDFG